MKGLAFYFGVVCVAAALAIGASFALATMGDEGRAQRLLFEAGYTDVELEHRGPAFGVLGGCSANDVVKFRFSAYRQAEGFGRRYTVTVCGQEPFGAYTIRG